MAFHHEREIERNRARGMSLVEAREAARRGFGNLGQTKEAMREAILWNRLARVQRDLRYAIRALRRAPAFSLTVILTISLALGLNGTAFTIFNAYVLRPIAVRDPGSLYAVSVLTGHGSERTPDSWMNWDDFRALQNGTAAFSDAFGSRTTFVRVDQVLSMGELVTSNYFRTLGVGTILGRPLLPSDAEAPGAGVLVLSHRVWTSRFGSDLQIVGRRVQVRGFPFTVVGVVGPQFTGLTETAIDFWAPISALKQFEDLDTTRSTALRPRLGVVGRLRPGISPEQAQQILGAWAAGQTANRPPEGRIAAVRLEPRSTTVPLSGEILLMFAPIACAFVLIMVIGCANVANMMLARGLARQREIGIRLALGAGRRQVVRQLLTEAAVLALPAAALGYLVSRATIGVGVRWMFATVPPAFASSLRMVPLSPDLRVFGFMLVAALCSAVLFGLAPALQVTRVEVVQATRGEFDGVKPARFRSALVVAQIAGCLLLLVVAGVLLRGSDRVRGLEPGFRTSNLVIIGTADGKRAAVVADLRGLPGVRSLAAAASAPADGAFPRVPATTHGRPEVRSVHYNLVSPEYFADLDMRLILGRTFSAEEARAGLPVAIVSRTAAARLWGAGSPIGRELSLGGDDEDLTLRGLRRFRTTRVIGVATDALAGCICTNVASPIAYFPIAADSPGIWLLVSTTGGAGLAKHAIDNAMGLRYPGAIEDLHTLEESVAVQAYPFRAAYWISGALGIIALLLTLTGIYGVLSYLVAQRTREIGIRMALGAGVGDVVGLVLRQSLRMAVIGGAIGLVLALGVSRLFASQLEIVNTFDPLAYLGSAALALSACVAAAWVPSRRAAAVNPIETLRQD